MLRMKIKIAVFVGRGRGRPRRLCRICRSGRSWTEGVIESATL